MQDNLTDAFITGKTYQRRQDIHDVYGSQRQDGISTPAQHPAIFIFTGAAGKIYDYRDEFRSGGTFWYTGEGQVGGIQMVEINGMPLKL